MKLGTIAGSLSSASALRWASFPLQRLFGRDLAPTPESIAFEGVKFLKRYIA